MGEIPQGYVGQYYKAYFSTTNAKTPIYKILIDDGRLPRGLEIKWDKQGNKSIGELEIIIEGIPEESGEFDIILYILCLGTMVDGQTGKYHLLIDIK